MKDWILIIITVLALSVAFVDFRSDSGSQETYQTQFAAVGDSIHAGWLGENYVYVEGRCGTSCDVYHLISLQEGFVKRMVVGYRFSEERGRWRAYVTDWFGNDQEFDGFVQGFRKEERAGREYFVISTEDRENNYTGEEWFLFTGKRMLHQKSRPM